MNSVYRWANKQNKRFKAILGCGFFVTPQISCRREKHGSESCGWVICSDKICRDSVIYSFGIGEDASFEASLIARYGAEVRAFDPTPKSINWVEQQGFPSQFKMHPLGLAENNGQVEFALPNNPEHVSGSIIRAEHVGCEMIRIEVKRLKNIMQEQGHARIDLLKMDIEGAEYGVVDSIVSDKLDIGQILIEFHHRFKGVGIDKTNQALDKLHRIGYRIFHVSENYEEISLIMAEK
jgi:FkbM family methyltransferase